MPWPICGRSSSSGYVVRRKYSINFADEPQRIFGFQPTLALSITLLTSWEALCSSVSAVCVRLLDMS